MTPFCCQAGVSADRESNMASCRWNANEGHGTVKRGARRRGEERRGREGEKKIKKERGREVVFQSPAFPVQIKSSTENR